MHPCQLIARLPHPALRRFGYRRLGVRMAPGVTIGYRTYITARHCTLGTGVIIGRNCGINCHTFVVGDHGKILDNNRFFGPGAVHLGSGVRVIGDHLFDATNGITLGDDVWVAGHGSQFWTHGTVHQRTERSITIGSDVYIGSASRFGPGSGVADGSCVAMGSVLTRHMVEPRCFVAGNPAEIVAHNLYWRDHWGRAAPITPTGAGASQAAPAASPIKAAPAASLSAEDPEAPWSETTLHQLVCETFLHGAPATITPQTRLLEEGICSSLELLQLAVAIEDRTPGLRIDDHEVTPEHFGSIAAIQRFLATKERHAP